MSKESGKTNAMTKHLLMTFLLIGTCAAQELPDAPKPTSPAHIYSFRTDFKAPALYSNHNLLKSKAFWASHAALAASAIVACRIKASGETWDSEMPAIAAVGGLDFVAAKYMSPLYMFGAPAWGIQHYIRASIR
jgi:hypothetical protein